MISWGRGRAGNGTLSPYKGEKKCKVSMLLKVGCKVSICLRESFHLLGKFDQPCVLHAIIHYLMM